MRPLVSPALKEHQRYRLVVEAAVPLVQTKTSKAPDRSREYNWLREHRHEYAGQYVALSGDRLLAHGTDGKTVLAEAEATSASLPYLVRIEGEDD